MFGSRGWAHTRIEDIAAAAGVSAATAYNHFPSKHSLIGHVYGPLLRPLLVQARRDVGSTRPVVDALEDQVRALARTTSRHRELTAAFYCAVQDYTIRVGGPPDPDDEIDPRTLVPMPDAVQMLVAAGQERGQLRRFPGAAEISSLVVNMLLLRAVNRPGEPADVGAELALTVLFGTLRPDLLLDVAEDRPFGSRH